MAGASATDPILMPSTASGAVELPIDPLGGGEGWLLWQAPVTGSVKLEFGNAAHPLVWLAANWWVLDHVPANEFDVTHNGLQEMFSTDHDGDGISYSDPANAHGNGVFPVFAGTYYVAKMFFDTDPTVVPVRWVTRTSIASTGAWLDVPPQDFPLPGSVGMSGLVQNTHMTPFFDGDGGSNFAGPDNGVRVYGDGPTMLAETYTGHGYYDADAYIDATSDPSASDIGTVTQPDLGYQSNDFHQGVTNSWSVSLGEHHYDFGTHGGPYGFLIATVSFVAVHANGVTAGAIIPVEVWHRTALTYANVFRGSVEMEAGPQGLTPAPATSALVVTIAGNSDLYATDSSGSVVEDLSLADTIYVLDATTDYPSLVTTPPDAVTQWLTPTDLSSLPVLDTIPLDHFGSGPTVELATTKTLLETQPSVIVLASGRHLTGTPLPAMDRYDGTSGGILSATLSLDSIGQKLRRSWPRVRLITYNDEPLPPWTTVQPLRQVGRADGSRQYPRAHLDGLRQVGRIP